MFRTELAQAEQDIALRLEELEGLQQQRDDLQQALAAERSAQAEAESSGDERRQKAALEDVQVRIDDLTALAQKIRTVQMLYDQAVAGYMLASERQRLYRVPAEGGSAGPRGPILMKERGSNLDY
ncbi:MAG: hypothetical protein WBM78_10025 [Desulfobacterales bacterium]